MGFERHSKHTSHFALIAHGALYPRLLLASSRPLKPVVGRSPQRFLNIDQSGRMKD
jgi:hypothetical protein